MPLRPLITMTIVGTLALAACGDDDDTAVDATPAVAASAGEDTGSVATNVETIATAVATTAPVETTARPAPTTAPAPGTTAGAGALVPGADPEADAAALAWTTAFDSTLGFDAKARFIADADALRPTIEAYTPAGAAVGGIALEPTAVVITGDTATITYDVTFAGLPAYQGLDGNLQRIDGEWIVTREEFCGFMASARNPCLE